VETVNLVRPPPCLEELTRRWRAIARYGIEKFGLGSDGYSREKTLMSEYTGLTYDQATAISTRLSTEAHEAAGNPPTNWGVTKYFPKLETPVPPRWKPADTSE
jgi:hypothetical protein